MMMILSVYTIKVGDNIPFIKDPLNKYLNVDLNTDFIQTVNQHGPTKPWNEALSIAKAVKGSSFAVIRDPTNKLVSHIYYQDPKLHLKECYYSHLGTTEQWVPGE